MLLCLKRAKKNALKIESSVCINFGYNLDKFYRARRRKWQGFSVEFRSN